MSRKSCSSFVLMCLFPVLTSAQDFEREIKAPGRIDGQGNLVAISPDGKTVAVVSSSPIPNSPPELSWFTLQTGERRGTVKLPGGASGIAFSPDGKTIAIGGGDIVGPVFRTFRILKLATGSDAMETQEHRPTIHALAVHYPTEKLKLLDPLKSPDPSKSKSTPPDQSKIDAPPQSTPTLAATSGAQGLGDIEIWDLKTGKIVGTLKCKIGGRNLAFFPDGRLVSSEVSAVKIWNVAERKQIGLFQTSPVMGLAVSPDGKLIAVSEQIGLKYSLRLLDANMEEEPISLPVRQEQATWKLAFSPDSKYLVTANSGGVISVWDLKQRKEVTTLRECGDQGVVFRPDGEYLVAASIRGAVRVYSMAKVLKK